MASGGARLYFLHGKHLPKFLHKKWRKKTILDYVLKNHLSVVHWNCHLIKELSVPVLLQSRSWAACEALGGGPESFRMSLSSPHSFRSDLGRAVWDILQWSFYSCGLNHAFCDVNLYMVTSSYYSLWVLAFQVTGKEEEQIFLDLLYLYSLASFLWLAQDFLPHSARRGTVTSLWKCYVGRNKHNFLWLRA